jgi:hypothetical protein
MDALIFCYVMGRGEGKPVLAWLTRTFALPVELCRLVAAPPRYVFSEAKIGMELERPI